MTYPPQQPGPYGYGNPAGNPYPQQPANPPAPGAWAPGNYGPNSPPGPMYGGGFPPYSAPPPPPRKKKTGLIVGIVIALVVVLGGGGTAALFLFSFSGGGKQPTASGAGPGSSGGAGNASAPLGDLTTLDPCSLVNTSSYQGRAIAFPDYFSSCYVFVTLASSGQTIDLTVYYSGTGDVHQIDQNQFTVTKQGALTVAVQPHPVSTGQCQGNVYYTDTNEIGMTTSADSGTSSSPSASDLCQVVTTAAADVVAAINGKTFKHLSYPSGSMGRVDVCGLLAASSVKSVVGGLGTTNTYPGGHSCYWGNWNNTSQPNVFFGTALYTGPEKTNTPGLTQQTMDGRQTLVVPSGSTVSSTGSVMTCRADTAVHTWPSWPGVMTPTSTGSTKIIEYATLEAAVSGTQDQACQAAVRLATMAWSRLPS